MARYKSEFLNILDQRGYISECSDIEALDQFASKEIVTAYIGFDCTAPTLHAGSLLPIMLLRWLQNTGHKPIVLMGGGTTRVGDPSGKDESRQLISDKKIQENMLGIKKIFSRYLAFSDNPNGAIMANNADWLDRLNYIQFLRDFGGHFTINRMLKFDSVKVRLEREQPLSFLEFNYMILQAYDFLELSRRYACNMQMGGSDQWGNILNGIELGRRIDKISLFGLTSPLLTNSSGAKMGKTASGAVWLDPERTPSFEFWQYWRNTEDQDVGRFLRLFTELPISEIEQIEVLEGSELNEGKIILATNVTAMLHGEKQAKLAEKTAHQTFDQGGSGEGLPTKEIPKEDLLAGIAAFSIFYWAKLAASKGEARRLIREGGCRINDKLVENELQIIGQVDLNTDGVIKLTAGKKRHMLVRPI